MSSDTRELIPRGYSPPSAAITASTSASSLYAAGHDEQLALGQLDVPVTELDGHAALEHEKEVVRVIVLVPDELALDLDDGELVVVEEADDPGAEGLVDARELLIQLMALSTVQATTRRWR
jgi:hypothetical protein